MPKAIIDTNVPKTANGKSEQASKSCVRACVEKLQAFQDNQNNGILIIDDRYRIIREYQRQLSQLSKKGESSPGGEFLRWVLNNYTNPQVCEIHTLTSDPAMEGNFLEFPDDPALAKFDISDRKFAALAAITGEEVWNAVDSDWWCYRIPLEQNGVKILFLCPDAFDGDCACAKDNQPN